MRILYNYATKSRRSNFLRGVQSIIDNSASDNFHILVSVEQEIYDQSMYPLPQLNCSHEYFINPYRPTSKVDAINRSIKEYKGNWDIVVNMSDDMIFTKKGFDNLIREQFVIQALGRGIDYFDQCVHFPDGTTGDKLMTMSVMGKSYYDRFKYIYHPSYKSLYCDNEAMEVAKEINRYKFVNENIFVHLHPANGNAPNDDQYRFTESFHPIDRQNYEQRRAKNFYL